MIRASSASKMDYNAYNPIESNRFRTVLGDLHLAALPSRASVEYT